MIFGKGSYSLWWKKPNEVHKTENKQKEPEPRVVVLPDPKKRFLRICLRVAFCLFDFASFMFFGASVLPYWLTVYPPKAQGSQDDPLLEKTVGIWKVRTENTSEIWSPMTLNATEHTAYTVTAVYSMRTLFCVATALYLWAFVCHLQAAKNDCTLTTMLVNKYHLCCFPLPSFSYMFAAGGATPCGMVGLILFLNVHADMARVAGLGEGAVSVIGECFYLAVGALTTSFFTHWVIFFLARSLLQGLEKQVHQLKQPMTVRLHGEALDGVVRIQTDSGRKELFINKPDMHCATVDKLYEQYV